MSKRSSKEPQFHSPFAGLGKKTSAAPPAKAEKKAAPPPPAKEKPAPTSTDDANLFSAAMTGVKPLSRSPKGERIAAIKQPPANKIVMQDNRLYDEQHALADLEALVRGNAAFRILDEDREVPSGLAPGVSFQLLERLEQGHFAWNKSLDLHGLSRSAAQHRVVQFIGQSRRDGERCVLIITGRGKSTPDGVAILRETLPEWLTQAPVRGHVLAFCPAQAIDGGPGAYYVLLRRKDSVKEK